jgi:osmotically-inducible protein OsmY
LPQTFTGRFSRDFYKYSQDFQDREDGAPGTDQDFGTRVASDPVESSELPVQMPEGDGVRESLRDREIREEVMDVLTRGASFAAQDVTVRVEDGVATLSGSVRSVHVKQSVENAVQSVPGVDSVVNCLITHSH